MRSRTSSSICLLAVFIATSARAASAQVLPAGQPPAIAQPAARPAIAVAPFDTDRTGWMPPPHFGETVADLLASRLVNLGSFRVFDRGVLPEPDQSHRAS